MPLILGARALGLVTLAAAFIVAPDASARIRVTRTELSVTDAGHYVLRWAVEPAGAPVFIQVAERSDAPVGERRLVSARDSNGSFIFVGTPGRRPFFFVSDGHGHGQWVAERLLPLQGGRNFRDLGGYATTDGRRVRWGMLYRSGSMADITPADYGYLARLGIRVICDFRTTAERRQEPYSWLDDAKVDYWTRDHEMSVGELGKVKLYAMTGAQAAAVMTGFYRRLPEEQAPALREMFRRLAGGQAPLVFNCTAGKDRTGLAAALILTLLGVPRETVVADYAATDRYLEPAKMVSKGMRAAMASFPADVSAALLRSDPAYIAAALTEIDTRYGSVEAYAEQMLGLSRKDLRKIRKVLLET